MRMLSWLYGCLAAQRRSWYTSRPEFQRHLRQPVISIGALSVGGSGKTPVVRCITELLIRNGERPALLSRGYGRSIRLDGVVVVSDGKKILADLPIAGDEPLMLAERLMSARVLVADDRFLAGSLAENRLDASVHVLDDGFQHLSLARDIDVIVIGESDLDDERTLPFGPLRERLTTASLADALIVETPSSEELTAVSERFGVQNCFRLVRHFDAPVTMTSEGMQPGARVFVVTGIARPFRFISGVLAAGFEIAGTMEFRDHHRFSLKDVDRIVARAKSLDAEFVLTSEKDIVRLKPYEPFEFPLAWLPLRVTIEPASQFERWLIETISETRSFSASNAC